MQGILIEKVSQWVSRFPVIQEAQKILLAVSGGADSVAMAYVLHQLQKNGKLNCDFVIGHVNHCLRGDESDADEAFVKQLGKTLGMEVVSQRVGVKEYAAEHKLSIETAGRQLRLKTLAKMAKQTSCNAIATAHHKDDLAETLIHRLMRGTGLRGLCGIWPVSEVYGSKFIRPMSGTRRAEIIRYCEDNKVIWRDDVSNTNINFTRNRIRHRLLPVLENESETIVDKLKNLSLKCQQFQLDTEKLAKNIIHKGHFNRNASCFTIDQELLKNCSVWVFYEVVRELLVQLGVGLRRYTRKHFTEVRRLIDDKKARLTLPENVAVEVSDTKLIVLSNNADGHEIALPYEDHPIQLEIGKNFSLGSWRISSKILELSKTNLSEFRKTKDSNVEWLDVNKIVGSVEIRWRKEGDRFWPIGAAGEKKVGRFLIDAQLDKETKQAAVIIKDNEKILWVAPIRMCEQAKITPQTQQILEIRIERKDSSAL